MNFQRCTQNVTVLLGKEPMYGQSIEGIVTTNKSGINGHYGYLFEEPVDEISGDPRHRR